MQPYRYSWTSITLPVNSCPTIKMLSPVQLTVFLEQYKSKLGKGLLLEPSHKVLYNYITLYNITTSLVAQTCFGKLYPWCNEVSLPISSFNISVELELEQEELPLMLCLQIFLNELIVAFLPLWLFLLFPSPNSLKHCLSPYSYDHDSLIVLHLFNFFFLFSLLNPLQVIPWILASMSSQPDLFLPSSPSIQSGQFPPFFPK